MHNLELDVQFLDGDCSPNEDYVRIEDREQCKEFISNDWNRHRCERKAKIEGYCKQHYNMNQRRR